MKHSELDDSQRVVIKGSDKGDQAGWAVDTAGDINGDGYDDIIIGAPYAANKKGESYVLFGGDFTGDSTVSSASGSDDLVVNAMNLDQDLPLRDKPLTSGDDAMFVSYESSDTCLGHIPDASPAATDVQGNGSDLVHDANQTDFQDDEEKPPF